MNANVIIAVAAVAVTLFTVIFIVVEQQMGFDENEIYYGTASSGDYSFNFAKTAAGPFVGFEEDGVGSVLIASVDTDTVGQVVKIIWNADGTLQACDVDPTMTGEMMDEWKSAPSASSGMGFTDPVTGVEYTYTVTEGEAPAGWLNDLPTIDDCKATADDDARARFLTETITDDSRGLATTEANMAWDSYYDSYTTYKVGNAAVYISGCRIAFRGSDDSTDWISNILGAFQGTVNVGGYSVHQGFAQEFFKLKDKVSPHYNSCGSSTRWIGHSLGGAMANVAKLHFGGGSVYTWGTPATLTSGSNQRWSGVREWHESDPVPAWGLSLFGRFKHVHGSSKIYHKCTRRSWWGRCTRSGYDKGGAGYNDRSWFGNPTFWAHSMDNYKNFS